MPIDPVSAGAGGGQSHPRTSPPPLSVGSGVPADVVGPGRSTLAIALTAAAQLSVARHQIRGWVIGAGVDADTARDISVAAYEAMANALEHGYPDRHGPVTITVHYHRGSGETDGTDGEGGEVRVVVSDEGSWSAGPRDIGWRGRGLKLITALGGQVEIRVGEHGTTTSMWWVLG